MSQAATAPSPFSWLAPSLPTVLFSPGHVTGAQSLRPSHVLTHYLKHSHSIQRGPLLMSPPLFLTFPLDRESIFISFHGICLLK